MSRNRRNLLLFIAGSALLPAQQHLPEPPPPLDSDKDQRLPNGKSQRDAMAREEHEQALKDARDLVAAAQQLKDELQRAGDYVVPISSVKRTEEIEKLARRIRARLKQ